MSGEPTRLWGFEFHKSKGKGTNFGKITSHMKLHREEKEEDLWSPDMHPRRPSTIASPAANGRVADFLSDLQLALVCERHGYRDYAVLIGMQISMHPRR